MVAGDKAIRSFRGTYAFLSNFYECKVVIDGKPYKSVEHYYQSMKSDDPKIQDDVASTPTPAAAKKMGRHVTLRSDWERIKDAIMLKALRAKFSIPELAKKLLDTGDVVLEELNSWHDTYWGVDSSTGRGQNKLGMMLMQTRDELKKALLLQ